MDPASMASTLVGRAQSPSRTGTPTMPCSGPHDEAEHMTTSPLPAGCIVVGVDGSEHAERAITWSAGQAALEGRTLALVHSADQFVLRETATLERQGIDRSELTLALSSAARATLDAARERATLAAPGVKVLTELVHTDAREALVDLSKDAWLIVLGSRGRGPMRTALLGSVSASVAKRAHCPVVVCRPPEHEPSAGIRVIVDAANRCLPAGSGVCVRAGVTPWHPAHRRELRLGCDRRHRRPGGRPGRRGRRPRRPAAVDWPSTSPISPRSTPTSRSARSWREDWSTSASPTTHSTPTWTPRWWSWAGPRPPVGRGSCTPHLPWPSWNERAPRSPWCPKLRRGNRDEHTHQRRRRGCQR